MERASSKEEDVAIKEDQKSVAVGVTYEWKGEGLLARKCAQ